ncbi:MAG: hypothetical protein JWN81_970 [Solirubrobacterales bacterium]|nr:hypothetical protein [Solirubrobacterales bacterium]
MRKTGMVGVCIAGVLAVSALAGASASAAVPEVGRCTRLTAPTGAYKYKSCVIPSPGHNGPFEFEPGPGPKPKFSALISLVTLETVGKATVKCGSGEFSGEWTGPKTASLNLLFGGCLNGATKKSCQTSPTAQADIKTEQALEGELGFIAGGEKPVVGLDVKPKSPSTVLLTFVCGGPPEVGVGEPWTVEGSVIGSIKPTNNMKLAFKLGYKAVAGKQIPEQFESGVKDTLITNRIVGIAPPITEQAGLTLKGETTQTILAEGEEPMEIKSK